MFVTFDLHEYHYDVDKNYAEILENFIFPI